MIDALGVGGGAEHSLAAMLPLLRDRGIESSVACLIPRVGGLQAQLSDAGFDVEVLDSGTWSGWIRSLRRKIRSEQPDIVHATLFNSCLVTRLACVGLPVHQINSLVNTSYDPVRLNELKIAPWKLRAMRTIDGLTARHLGERFHAITDVVAREATDVLRIDESLITVIPRVATRGRSVDPRHSAARRYAPDSASWRTPRSCSTWVGRMRRRLMSI
ncbi:MAG: glycosyltransferase family 4 protein [Microthrixaceae bacterium]|nr:glycosyltransferase family 4 protein [Microthrixaceae bacterium]